MGNKNSFSFKNVQRRYFNTQLKSGRTLLVGMPKKSVFERMNDARNIDSQDAAAFDEICGIMADILSNNKQGVKVTAQEVVDSYDLEEILTYIKAYSKFVNGLTEEKN